MHKFWSVTNIIIIIVTAAATTTTTITIAIIIAIIITITITTTLILLIIIIEHLASRGGLRAVGRLEMPCARCRKWSLRYRWVETSRADCWLEDAWHGHKKEDYLRGVCWVRVCTPSCEDNELLRKLLDAQMLVQWAKELLEESQNQLHSFRVSLEGVLARKQEALQRDLARAEDPWSNASARFP